MYNKNKFSALDINHFLDLNEYYIKEDFSYAEIPGTANICGYHIIFFYIDDKIEVLSIDSDVMNNTFLLDKANQILNFLGFDFKLGCPFVLTDMFNHNYIFKDHIYEDHMRYYYEVDEQLIVLGITFAGILVSFEIVNNQRIIDNRLEYLKS
ncbi:hypothetical protein [Gilliamella sp. ESL0250]|uniref:hypothetical protein n=1 Tax=Gilliamella sp. ESL0250 TaxID=2705036 RepID=UPI001580DDB2|nr:hypothetical protein [Gilliamella sp. ESL0250]NUF50223.1 hypothetical protein [Gilliamella sp. ESL0250]